AEHRGGGAGAASTAERARGPWSRSAVVAPRALRPPRKSLGATMTTLGRAGHPPPYAAAAKAKLARDRKSFEAFREVDQAEHERGHQLRTAAALKTAQDEVLLWGEDVAELEPDAVSALAAFRLAGAPGP